MKYIQVVFNIFGRKQVWAILLPVVFVFGSLDLNGQHGKFSDLGKNIEERIATGEQIGVSIKLCGAGRERELLDTYHPPSGKGVPACKLSDTVFKTEQVEEISVDVNVKKELK